MMLMCPYGQNKEVIKLPNGSHSTGPSWSDVISKSDVKKIVLETIEERIELIEYKIILLEKQISYMKRRNEL